MAEVAKRYQDELPRIKKNIENAHNYFKENYRRYSKFRKYIFKDQLGDDYRKQLEMMGKPQMEFNILEAFISKLRGEFASQEPSVEVLSDYNSSVDFRTIEVVEGHLRHIIDEAKKNGAIYNAYTNTLSGGFDVFKIWTEYAHEKSFNQIIKFGQVYSPVLTFFDPIARLPHKGDGRYCGEVFPVTKEDFEAEYPDADISKLDFTRKNTLGDFNWSYHNQTEKILLKCDYYEKKKKKIKIVQIADSQRLGQGVTMTEDEYEQLTAKWEELQFPEPLPAIAHKRTSETEIICRYKIIENQVLKYEELDYKIFPLIFIDGNSAIIQEVDDGTTKQITRPYVYNAKGMQDLMNFAGNSTGQELSNIIQQQYHIHEEAIPSAQQYIDVYANPQKGNLLVSKAYADKEQQKPLPPPTVIQRQAIPPQIAETFMSAPQTIQSILGAYDAATVQTNNPLLSGKAIERGATQSNAASMPYIVNILAAINRVLEGSLALIPKYFITPRTIPVLDGEGNRSYQKINTGEPDSVKMDYDENVLQVRVEAGPTFGLQQDEALKQTAMLCQAMPGFGDFVQKKGLKFIVKNLHIKGADELVELAKQYEQELAQQMQMQQQMQQQQMQMNPLVLKAKNDQMKLQLDAKKHEDDVTIESGKLALGEEELEIKRMLLMAEMEGKKTEAFIAIDKHIAEKTRAAVDLAISQLQYKHQREKDINSAHHEVMKEILGHERHFASLSSLHEAKEARGHEAKESKEFEAGENEELNES